MSHDRSSAVAGLGFPIGSFSSSNSSPSPPSPSSSSAANSSSSSYLMPSSSTSTAPSSIPPRMGPGGLPFSPVFAPQSMLTDKRKRSWTEKFSYEVGTGFGVGFVGGSVFGGLQGLVKPLPGGNFKLRINSILNNAGRLSTASANGFAVFAIVYSMSRSFAHWKMRPAHLNTFQPGVPLTLEQAIYEENDSLSEGIGVGVATALTGKARFNWSRSLALGVLMGGVMVGGIQLRKQLIDEKGIQLKHF